ncbi:hypothetical protein ABBQ32_009119 [Trebouxia sp. C0010 RCD-2024]
MLTTAAERVGQASRRILVADPTASTAESTKKLQRSAAANVVCGFSLAGICILAFSLRLFSVIKYESVIHEFDPYFNYRVTQYLTKEGFYNLWNWFDDRTWYPLGRVIGGTVYPGLIYTAGVMWNVLHFFNIPIHVQEVCVFTAPLFSAFCALTTYFLAKEVRSQGAGLFAALFAASVPSYISRSVAGSYDNEGVAIFALVLVFFLYVKVASWGGYSFIINLLPIHCLACIFLGRMNSRLYVAYAPFIVLGTIEAASIPVVGFNAVLMSEHFGSFLAFGVLHAAMGMQYIKHILPARTYNAAKALAVSAGVAVLGVVMVLLLGYVMASPTFGWTGRSLSLLDPTYASKYIPIIASVSEHQPPAWNSYFTDVHILVLLAPLGLIACFRPLTDASLFLILYGVTAVYFSGVMVRLMLVLAPATCCLGGIAADQIMVTFCKSIRPEEGSGGWSGIFKTWLDGPEPHTQEDTVSVDAKPAASTTSSAGTGKRYKGSARNRVKEATNKGTEASPFNAFNLFGNAKQKLPRDVGIVGAMFFFSMLVFYIFHCCWVSAEMYSAPSIVLQSRSPQGGVHVFDDFREAYGWLRHNTDEEAKVASWWDYGYQTTAMANRTVIVDNNTWNNTHIATVGRAMASPEHQAWQIYRDLDVKYVLVVFGGFVGYPSDDINKFLWMVRIGGGVFPDIKEPDYLGERGYTIDDKAGKAMLDCIMYKMSYYKFAQAAEMTTGRYGFDRVRNTNIGVPDISLKYFEEVYTTEHWMVRIYEVKDQPSRGVHTDASRKGKNQLKRVSPSGKSRTPPTW